MDVDMVPVAAAAASSSSAAAAASSSSSSVGVGSASTFRHTYIVTAQPPTVVTQSLVCHFTGRHDTNLIVGRSTRIEIYRCTQDGLESMHEVDIYGAIASIVPFKAKTDSTHRLFITTERHKFFVLRWDADTRELRTEAQGDSKVKIGRLTENSTIALVDPTNSWFGLQQYDGVLQMLAIEPNGTLDKTIYDCKFDQLQVIQLAFLHQCAKPTVLVLSNEVTAGQDRRVLKSWTYEAKEKDMRHAKDGINLDQCDYGASHIIPTVFGGALLLCEESICHFPGPGKSPQHTKVTPWRPTATGVIDARRFLVGCLDGSLYVVILEDGAPAAAAAAAAASSASDSAVLGSNVSLKVEYLGQTSIAYTLTYIDNGFVLVGSTWGDSQLIQMTQEPVMPEEDDHQTTTMAESKESDAMDTSENNAAAPAASSSSASVSVVAPARPSFLRVVNTFPNLGAILDMTSVDLDRSGQCQVLTCSGGYQDSSLRVIRNGIGLSEEASIELEGIQGVWGVREKSADEYHRYLVQTYASETRVLALEKEEETDEEALAECEIAGFDAAQRTLFAGNMGERWLVQVTANACRLVDSTTLQLVDEWKPSTGGKIDVATANTHQLLVSSGKNVILLSLQGDKWQVDRQTTLDQQVACMDITPIGGAARATVAAICMWNDNTLRLYDLASLQEWSRERLGEVVARSVLFTQFDATVTEVDPTAPSAFLLVGLGDGQLVSFELQPTTGGAAAAAVPTLTARKRIALGTSTIELTSFRSRGELHVFVSCDRPTVVSNAHGKLRYSNVNMRDLTHMTPFHAPVFRDCLALVSPTELAIGHIDEIEKLHIKKISLEGGFGRRLTHQASTRTLAAIVHVAEKTDAASKTGEVCTIRLFDSVHFRKLDEFKLERDEQAQAILSHPLQIHGSGSSSSSFSASSEYFIVGTAYVDPNELEPSLGRILVFQVDTTVDADRPTLKLISSTTIKGAAYTLDTLQGRIVAGINAKVVVYRCITSLETPLGEFKLEKECDYAGNVFVTKVRASKDGQYLMVQDIMKSISVLMFHAPTNVNGVQTAATAATLDEVARHYDSLWLLAFENFSPHDDLLLTADSQRNLMTLKRNLDPAVTAEERQRLETVGKWHSGEQINVITPGSLVMNLPSEAEAASAGAGPTTTALDAARLAGSDDRVIPTHLLGAASGAILVAAPLSHASYTFFAKLEAELEQVVRGVGGLSHREWRQFHDEKKVEDSQAFIDGDLIQLFLELAHKQQEQVAKAIGVKLQECIKRVEDCSRIH